MYYKVQFKVTEANYIIVEAENKNQAEVKAAQKFCKDINNNIVWITENIEEVEKVE